MWLWCLLRYPWNTTYHFRLFFPTITMEIRTFHFRTTMVQRSNFSLKNVDQFLWDLWKGTGDHWYNYGMWYINLVCFFSTKKMGIIKIHFWHCAGKMQPRPTGTVLNVTTSFVPESVCCCSALCLFSKDFMQRDERLVNHSDNLDMTIDIDNRVVALWKMLHSPMTFLNTSHGWKQTNKQTNKKA